MNVASTSPFIGASTDPAALQRMMENSGQPAGAASAKQFEAVLVRQLLGDALKPMLEAEPGESAPGSDIYQYLVTDVVSGAVSSGQGIGISKMLTPYLTPKNDSAHAEPKKSIL